jgi:hypothetical protein
VLMCVDDQTCVRVGEHSMNIGRLALSLRCVGSRRRVQSRLLQADVPSRLDVVKPLSVDADVSLIGCSALGWGGPIAHVGPCGCTHVKSSGFGEITLCFSRRRHNRTRGAASLSVGR